MKRVAKKTRKIREDQRYMGGDIPLYSVCPVCGEKKKLIMLIFIGDSTTTESGMNQDYTSVRFVSVFTINLRSERAVKEKTLLAILSAVIATAPKENLPTDIKVGTKWEVLGFPIQVEVLGVKGNQVVAIIDSVNETVLKEPKVGVFDIDSFLSTHRLIPEFKLEQQSEITYTEVTDGMLTFAQAMAEVTKGRKVRYHLWGENKFCVQQGGDVLLTKVGKKYIKTTKYKPTPLEQSNGWLVVE